MHSRHIFFESVYQTVICVKTGFAVVTYLFFQQVRFG